MNKNKKKILFLCQIKGSINGAQTYNRYIYNHLKKNQKFKIDYLDTNLGYNVANTGEFNFIKFLKFIFFYFNFLKLFNKYEIFYIVPGNTFLGILRFYLIIIILKIFKKKIIFHHHGYGTFLYIKKFNFLKTIFINSNYINLVLTNDLKKKLLKIDKKFNILVIKNFFDLKIKRKKKINKKLKILFFSNHMKEKGFENFVKLSHFFKKFEFIICGKSNDWSKNILKNNSNKNINYLGFVSEKNKKDVYLSSDLFILQTYYKTEAVPATLLDAMASSCAIITTMHNGIPETVGKSALFVKKNDFDDLVNKVKFITKNNQILKKYQIKSFTRYKKSLVSKQKYLKKIESIFDIF